MATLDEPVGENLPCKMPWNNRQMWYTIVAIVPRLGDDPMFQRALPHHDQPHGPAARPRAMGRGSEPHNGTLSLQLRRARVRITVRPSSAAANWSVLLMAERVRMM